MADDRDSYKGQPITLELHEDDVSGGVPSDPVRVRIFQDKEVCYSTTTITPIAGGWSILLNTNSILYTGDYVDQWELGIGDGYVEKSLRVSEAMSNIPARATGNYSYYSKDICYEVQPDGDLYRLYNDTAIAARIESVVMTIRGSLYNEPDHGTDLYRFLFSSSLNVSDEIRLELEVRIQAQVPQVKVVKITVSPMDYNTYTVFITFYNLASATPNELLSMTNLVSVEQVTGG